MAKERMITRTINTTIVTVQGYNRKEKKMETKVGTFNGKVDTENELEIFTKFDTFEFRTLEILSTEIVSEKRAMPEWYFIQNSKPITEKEAEELEAE